FVIGAPVVRSGANAKRLWERLQPRLESQHARMLGARSRLKPLPQKCVSVATTYVQPASRVAHRALCDNARAVTVRHAGTTERQMGLPGSFAAFRIHNDDAGYRSGIEQLSLDELSQGEIVVRTAFSSVNFKDALAATGKGRILREFPLVGGIDVAGHVVSSADPRFREGDQVLVTGSGLSETRDGGYSQYARVEAKWAVPLPMGLSLRESMILGTAGFTAALALLRMQENRQDPSLGPLAVTGATGGVGSLAVDIFSRAGYTVHAISGKPAHVDYLRSIGASDVLGRDALATTRPLESVRF